MMTKRRIWTRDNFRIGWVHFSRTTVPIGIIRWLFLFPSVVVVTGLGVAAVLLGPTLDEPWSAIAYFQPAGSALYVVHCFIGYVVHLGAVVSDHENRKAPTDDELMGLPRGERRRLQKERRKSHGPSRLG